MSSLKEKFLQKFRNEHGRDIVFREISDDFFSSHVKENNIEYFVSIIFYRAFVSIQWEIKATMGKHRIENPSYYLVKEEKGNIIIYTEKYFLYNKQYTREDFLKHPDNKKIIAKKRFINNKP